MTKTTSTKMIKRKSCEHCQVWSIGKTIHKPGCKELKNGEYVSIHVEVKPAKKKVNTFKIGRIKVA